MAFDFVNRIGFDVTDAQQAINALERELVKYNHTVDDLVKTERVMTASGKEVAVNLKLINGEGKELNITLAKTKKGFETKNASLKQVGTGLNQYKQRLIETRQALDNFFRTAAKVATEQAKINKAANQQTAQGLDSFFKSAVKVANEQGKINKQLKEQQTILRNTQTLAKTAQAIIGPNIGQASITQVKSLNAAIGQIAVSIAKGKFTLQDFDIALARFTRQGPGALIGMNKDLLNSVLAFGNATQKAGETAVQSGQRIILTWTGLARLFVVQQLHQIIGRFTNELIQATRASIQFGIKIAEIQTISQRGGKDFGAWTQEVLALSNAFGESNTTVAKGVYDALSNQVIEASNSFVFMNEVLKFSLASVSSAENSVNLLSSALKSFRISTTEVERVAATLFKTIDLGRVTASEMANTFGRIGALANTLGVTLEETGAAVATLTVQGVGFSEAETLINNVLLKLIKPTEEMNELFKEWGVSTGDAAIKTFGFAGVLERLDSEAQKGTGRLGELLNEMRALRGIVGLTGSAFKDFDSNLKQITEGGLQDYRNAINIVADNDSKKLQVELNKLKNFFEVELGQSLISVLTQFQSFFGGFVPFARNSITLLGSLATAFVGARIATALSNSALLAWAGSLTTVRTITAVGVVQVSGMTAVMTNLRTAMLGLLSPASLAFIAVGALTAAFLNSAASAAEAKAELQEYSSNLIERATKAQQAQADLEREQTKILKEQLNERFRAVNENLANTLAASNKLGQQISENAKANVKAFLSYIETVNNRAKEIVKEAETRTKKLNDIVNDAVEREKNLKVDAKDKEFRANIDLAEDPVDKIRILQDEIFRLEDVARNLVEQGENATTEQLQAAVEVQKRQAELADELLRLNIDNAKNLNKEEAKLREAQIREDIQANDQLVKVLEGRLKDAQRRGNDLNRGLADNKRIRDLERQLKEAQDNAVKLQNNLNLQQNAAKNLADAQKLVNDVLVARLELNERLKKQAEEERAKAVAEEAVLGVRKKRFDDSFEGLDKIKPEFDSQIAGTPEQIRTNLEEQRNKFLNQLEKQKADILNAATALGVNDQKFIEELNRTTDNIKNQINQNFATASLEATQNAMLQRQDLIKKQFDEIIAKIEETGKATTNFGEQAATGAKGLGQLLKAGFGVGDVAGTDILGNFPTNVASQNALTEIVKSIETALLTGGSLQDVTAQLEKIKEAVNYLNKHQIIDPQEFQKINAAFNELVKNLNGFNQQKQLGQNLQQEQATIQTIIDDVKIKLAEFGKAGQDAGQAAADGQKTNEEKIKNTQRELDVLINMYKALKEVIGAAAQANAQAPVNKALGGMIAGYYSNGGATRGLDNVPAMLSKGEFVVSSSNASKFYSQLVAINSGREPRNFSQGGNVTTVGDIHITVQGGDTAQQTIRQIGRGLKQQIRLGTIRLS